MKRKPFSNNSTRDLLRYAGLGAQMLASIGIAIFAGLKADQWLHSSPLLTCVLPLLVLGAILYQVARQTGGKK